MAMMTMRAPAPLNAFANSSIILMAIRDWASSPKNAMQRTSAADSRETAPAPDEQESGQGMGLIFLALLCGELLQVIFVLATIGLFGDFQRSRRQLAARFLYFYTPLLDVDDVLDGSQCPRGFIGGVGSGRGLIGR